MWPSIKLKTPQDFSTTQVGLPLSKIEPNPDDLMGITGVCRAVQNSGVNVSHSFLQTWFRNNSVVGVCEAIDILKLDRESNLRYVGNEFRTILTNDDGSVTDQKDICDL